MGTESVTYGIQSEIELPQYDCFVTLYFDGDKWDQDAESGVDYTDLEEVKTIVKELRERFPDIEIKSLKISSKTTEIKSIHEMEYVDV